MSTEFPGIAKYLNQPKFGKTTKVSYMQKLLHYGRRQLPPLPQ